MRPYWIFSVRSFLFITILAIVSSCIKKAPEEITVGIQPYDNISDKTCLELKKKIKSYYGFHVLILPKKTIPKRFYTNIKSPRYRADSIIKHLKNIKPNSTDYLLGVTTKDISTTKKDPWGNIKKPEFKYKDWGVFGLGYRPGPSCVISKYRLGNGIQAKDRLHKIALHELGHNLGLKHCPNKGCCMQDAAEKISTIDHVKENLCKKCKSKI